MSAVSVAWASLRYWTIFFSDWVMGRLPARRLRALSGATRSRGADARGRRAAPRRAAGAQPIFSEETKLV